MSSYRARKHIPDNWAQMGSCPICDRHSLFVERTNGEADRLSCTGCEASFEMEIDGPNIRLVILPPQYAAYIQPAWEAWMTVHEIRQQIQSAVNVHPAQPVDPRAKEDTTSFSEFASSLGGDPNEISRPLTQLEVNKRAQGLAALGNSPKEIRETLSTFTTTEEQVDLALVDIEKQKKGKPVTWTRTVILVLGILAICLGAAAVLLPKLDITRYINVSQPIIQKMQGTVTNGESMPLSNSPTQILTPIPGNLPDAANAYFSVVWSLPPKYYDKADMIRKISPPPDLAGMHNEIVTRYVTVGDLQREMDDNQALFDQFCTTTTAYQSDRCQKLMSELASTKISFLDEEAKLYNYWYQTVCARFEEYYKAYSAAWPFGPGRCAYP